MSRSKPKITDAQGPAIRVEPAVHAGLTEAARRLDLYGPGIVARRLLAEYADPEAAVARWIELAARDAEAQTASRA